jgi:hypothetical protein
VAEPMRITHVFGLNRQQKQKLENQRVPHLAGVRWRSSGCTDGLLRARASGAPAAVRRLRKRAHYVHVEDG